MNLAKQLLLTTNTEFVSNKQAFHNSRPLSFNHSITPGSEYTAYSKSTVLSQFRRHITPFILPLNSSLCYLFKLGTFLDFNSPPLSQKIKKFLLHLFTLSQG